MKGLRCCVLGGSGFIGQHLCLRLIAEGCSVSAFSQKNRPNIPDVDWYFGDIGDINAIAPALAGADIVYYLVSTSNPVLADLDKLADLNTNLRPLLQILDLCCRMSIRRIVFSSSGGTVYGQASKPPFSETALPEPISSYGIVKLAMERYLLMHNQTEQMQNVVLRIANPYGPLQSGKMQQGVIATLIQKALSEQTMQIWGDGSIIRDYIFIDDVVEALVISGGHEYADGIFNIGSGIGRNLNSVIDIIEKIMKIEIAKEYRAKRKFDVLESILDIERARLVLGWSPQASWEQSLRTTVDWWCENKQ